MNKLIGYGEFDSDDGCISQEILRRLFLEGVSTHGQRALTELSKKPFRHFAHCTIEFLNSLKESLAYLPPVKIPKDEQVELKALFDSYLTSPGLIEEDLRLPGLPKEKIVFLKLALAKSKLEASFVTSIVEWGKTSHLNASWCYIAAIDTLKRWGDCPDLMKKEYLAFETISLRGMHDVTDLHSIEAPKPPDGFPYFNPLFQTQSEYLKSLRDNLSESLGLSEDSLNTFTARHVPIKFGIEQIIGRAEKYCNEVARYANQHYKRLQNLPEIEKHIKWTVLFQIKEMSNTDIIREAGRERGKKELSSTVQRAVEQILSGIGLTKRQVVIGRPRGRKEINRRRPRRSH